MKTFHDDRYQTLTFIAVHFKFAAMYPDCPHNQVAREKCIFMCSCAVSFHS